MNRNPRVVRRIVGLSILAAAIAMVITLAPGSVSASAQTDTVTIELAEVDVPGVSGTATLSASGEATQVDLMLSGPGVTGDHPTHIHTGTCDNFDPNPLYPLTTVVLDPVDNMGLSTTEVDVALDELLAEEFVVVVHQSEEALTTYLVCGEITETSGPTEEEPSPTAEAVEPTTEVSAPTATAATPAAGGSVPTTGVGSTVRSETGLLTLALGAAAALLLAAALGLRLRTAGADR